jgi:hypothetical protein
VSNGNAESGRPTHLREATHVSRHVGRGRPGGVADFGWACTDTLGVNGGSGFAMVENARGSDADLPAQPISLTTIAQPS